ncbi:hypothetical protein HCG49_16800 [Arenibacter sp. 6A1]|uniref:BfmA/BtgA family mobilization protein n=1 Tax=Arenibacter sp. 6A1 TaxID=2720391 RepID=UPI0014451F21|nr:BfmA/BtgA family mobilization protein [Arenibacter sp. 6A1]NKI28214.1 hypothetical protein [Arenibacter sp. 6A1]
MNRTMKIEEEVAVRLALLKKKFKKGSYSDLLEVFCDFFEVTRMGPGDLDSSRKPAGAVITERSNRIIAFIKKSEDTYLKEILHLVEKIYVTTNNNTSIPPTPRTEANAMTVQEAPSFPTKEIEAMVEERTQKLHLENSRLRQEATDAKYRLEHQRKFIREFLGMMKKQSLGNNWTVTNEQYHYYKEELERP